jgi:hypothetical protein
MICLAVLGLLGGPMSALALAGPEVPSNDCELARFLGYENVRECDPDQ